LIIGYWNLVIIWNLVLGYWLFICLRHFFTSFEFAFAFISSIFVLLMAKKIKIGVLASGGGTNLQAILEACEKKEIDAEVCVVISDVPSAKALERAKKFGVPTSVHERKGFPSKDAYEQAIVADLKKHSVELVCLAGYMRIVGKDFLKAFPDRVINIHPALLPSFPGLDVQKKAIDYGVKFSGCTVHFVTEDVDAGPIVTQAAVPVLDDDTSDTLAARILKEEHRIYTEAINIILSGKYKIEGRRVILTV
jgi:phosphoribosylglycinamide formyltransferase-1